MSNPVPYETAIDLLDADHKAVEQLFIEYAALAGDASPAAVRQTVAEKICQALIVHAQIEEEIFYPAVRKATEDESLLDEALAEHAQAKKLIAAIQGMKATSDNYDATVQRLADAIDEHVLEEREQIFMEAQQAPLDLRGLAVRLYKRKKELTAAVAKTPRTAKEKA